MRLRVLSDILADQALISAWSVLRLATDAYQDSVHLAIVHLCCIKESVMLRVLMEVFRIRLYVINAIAPVQPVFPFKHVLTASILTISSIHRAYLNAQIYTTRIQPVINASNAPNHASTAIWQAVWAVFLSFICSSKYVHYLVSTLFILITQVWYARSVSFLVIPARDGLEVVKVVPRHITFWMLVAIWTVLMDTMLIMLNAWNVHLAV